MKRIKKRLGKLKIPMRELRENKRSKPLEFKEWGIGIMRERKKVRSLGMYDRMAAEKELFQPVLDKYKRLLIPGATPGNFWYNMYSA